MVKLFSPISLVEGKVEKIDEAEALVVVPPVKVAYMRREKYLEKRKSSSADVEVLD